MKNTNKSTETPAGAFARLRAGTFTRGATIFVRSTALALLCAGCSSMISTTSHTLKPDGTQITDTHLRVRTLFDSKSELSKFNARNSDRSQSIGVGSYEAQSSGTNAMRAVETIVGAAVRAAIKP
jgi:hypothetical protein